MIASGSSFSRLLAAVAAVAAAAEAAELHFWDPLGVLVIAFSVLSVWHIIYSSQWYSCSEWSRDRLLVLNLAMRLTSHGKVPLWQMSPSEPECCFGWSISMYSKITGHFNMYKWIVVTVAARWATFGSVKGQRSQWTCKNAATVSMANLEYTTQANTCTGCL